MIKPRDVLALTEKVCLAGSAVSLLAIMILTTLDVLMRKLIDYSLPSLYEFTEDYLMVALVFLSLSHVYVKGGHVRVTIFEELIPGPVRRPLNILMELLALALFGLIAVKGWDNAVRSLLYWEVSSSLLAYPLSPALFFVPLGSGLLCIRIIQSAVSSLAKRPAPGPAGVKGRQ